MCNLTSGARLIQSGRSCGSGQQGQCGGPDHVQECCKDAVWVWISKGMLFGGQHASHQAVGGAADSSYMESKLQVSMLLARAKGH